jgi:hypothetical protein
VHHAVADKPDDTAAAPATSPATAAATAVAVANCRPITHIDWVHTRAGVEYVIFAGGLPNDETGCMPSITVLKGQSNATVLEMEHR